MTVLEIKDAVRSRDSFCCVDCGMTNQQHIAKHKRQLDVHRLDPGSQYTLDGCVTLCRSCHHSKPRRPRGAPDFYGKHLVHKVTLHGRLLAALEQLVERNASRLKAEIAIAIRERLERNGFWPPKPEAS